MYVQNSFSDDNKGKLYIIPTPIGNLEDITYRAVRILEEVDLIAAEDTRHTQKLLNHFAIKNELISYHEHNRMERISFLISQMSEGKDVGLVSDAGMPAISDPGSELVKALVEKDYPVIVLPGANAAINALVGSGLPTDSFLFKGFLPRKKSEKVAALNELNQINTTLIFYESPHRVIKTLEVIEEVLGNRKVALARELTKRYEQFIRGEIASVLEWCQDNPLRGECVLVVEASSKESKHMNQWWEALPIPDHVSHYEKDMSHKDAMRMVAQDRNLSRRDIYRALHVDK